ncbi:serine hydrolase domain-containing protein [Glycomyces salinus]|uniref:serine hydrolase domain-containing protein n=1 Tax=Glycomyces salinus TaxID=980294 RepID=UPI0018EC95EA|nr:serine hydrolase domain-containing protein [Glycomyces salinus]
MRRHLPIAGALALSLIALPATATAQEPSESGLDEALLEQKLEDFHEATGYSLIAEVRDGDQSWSDSVGPRNLEWPWFDVDEDDRFRIASITKPMVATVLFQLDAEGELDLDGRISDHLPGLLPYEDEPTIRQVLSHTGGLPEYFGYLYPSLIDNDISDVVDGHREHYSAEELVEIGTQDPQLFEPGTDWSYSNTGYMALGLLIEEVTGSKLRHELRERVFWPAGMWDSYLPPGRAWGIWGPNPVPYLTTGDEDDPLFDTTRLSNSQLWAAGGVISTTEDVNDFWDAYLDGTLLTAEQLDEASEFVDTDFGFGYGLGLMEYQICPEGEASIGHNGGGLGHQTLSFHSPDGDRDMTFTMNVDDRHGYADPEEFQYAYAGLLLATMCGLDIDDLEAGQASTLTDQLPSEEPALL